MHAALVGRSGTRKDTHYVSGAHVALVGRSGTRNGTRYVSGAHAAQLGVFVLLETPSPRVCRPSESTRSPATPAVVRPPPRGQPTAGGGFDIRVRSSMRRYIFACEFSGSSVITWRQCSSALVVSPSDNKMTPSWRRAGM